MATVIEDPRLITDVGNEEVGNVHDASDATWNSLSGRNGRFAILPARSKGRSSRLTGTRSHRPLLFLSRSGPTFDAMVAEIIEWRLAEYLLRPSVVGQGSGGALRCPVSHSSGNPIIRIDRAKYPHLPTQPTEVLVDGDTLTFNFVKIAVNVARRAGRSR